MPRPNPAETIGITGIDKKAAEGPVEVRAPGPKGARLGSGLVVSRLDHDVTVRMPFRALTREAELLPRLLAADAPPQEVKELAKRRAPRSHASDDACSGR